MEHLKSLLQMELISGYQLETTLIYLTVLSLCSFILSLLLLPYLIRKIPSDYFLTLSKDPPKATKYNISRIFLYLFRNTVGFFLFISGIAMLFLPGQGLITIFISLLLLDFPWKRKLILHLVSNKKIQNTINWIRKKAHRKPIDWPPSN